MDQQNQILLIYHLVSRSGCHPSYPGGGFLGDSHLSVSVREGFPRDRPRLFGTRFKDRVERGIVILMHSLLERPQEFNRYLCKLSLELSVTFSFEMRDAFVGRLAAQQMING